MKKITVLLGVVLSLSIVQGANILGIWFHPAKSHHRLGEVLFKELARRGHNVTMASTYPLKEAFPNYTDVHLTGIQEDLNARANIFLDMNKQSVFKFWSLMYELTEIHTEMTLIHPEMKRLLDSGTKFDLVMTDCFLNFGLWYFGKLFGAPVIPFASQGTVTVSSFLTGNPEELSYVPVFGLDFPEEMSFLERATNGLVYLYVNLKLKWYIRNHEDLIKKHFNDTMTEKDMVDTLALVLSNGHYSFERPKPHVPNIIPIGGFHVKAPKKLPKRFQEFLDSAEKGAILFSLGSHVRISLLPAKTLKDIMKVFSDLPYKIIFKSEKEDLENIPKNVLVSKWCPQNDILAHPNMKLFISHGGLLSTIEAIHHAVPVLGIPVFGDQKMNILSAVRKGYAMQLDLEDVNEESFSKPINEMMDNPKYKDRVAKLSSLLKDQPLPPLDTAVFWVEHVIRHKGGSHLKNYSTNLSWYQYYMIDVVIFLAMIVFLTLAVVYVIMRKFLLFIAHSFMNVKSEKLKNS